MGDYCWMLYGDDANHPYKRKSYVKHKIFEVFLFHLVLIAVLSGTQIESKHFPETFSEKHLLKLPRKDFFEMVLIQAA